MKQRLIWPVLALAVLLSACGADGKAYTTADAQALIDADAFDGEMEQVDSYTVALLYGLEDERCYRLCQLYCHQFLGKC